MTMCPQGRLVEVHYVYQGRIYRGQAMGASAPPFGLDPEIFNSVQLYN